MNEIQQWLEDPARNYDEGVELYARYSRNKALVGYFRTGTPRFRIAKLVYELGKISRLADVQAKPVVVKPAASVRTGMSDIPDYILAAKKEVSSLYSQIDRMHTELYDLGTSNSDSVVRKRKAILDSRIPVIERADRLYRLKEEWFALPDGSQRKKVAGRIREMLSEQAAPMGGKSPEKKTPAADVAKLNDIDLSKRRTQLRSTITKTQNMLQYQSIRKSETPAPMPEGPKRTELEDKLKGLKEELEAVTVELDKRTQR